MNLVVVLNHGRAHVSILLEIPKFISKKLGRILELLKTKDPVKLEELVNNYQKIEGV